MNGLVYALLEGRDYSSDIFIAPFSTFGLSTVNDGLASLATNEQTRAYIRLASMHNRESSFTRSLVLFGLVSPLPILWIPCPQQLPIPIHWNPQRINLLPPCLPQISLLLPLILHSIPISHIHFVFSS